MTGYDGEAALDEAVDAVAKDAAPDAVAVAWVLAFAYQTPGMDDQTGYAWRTPTGQGTHSSIGLLDIADRLMWAEGMEDDQ